jgi:hypothetical protein
MKQLCITKEKKHVLLMTSISPLYIPSIRDYYNMYEQTCISAKNSV